MLRCRIACPLVLLVLLGRSAWAGAQESPAAPGETAVPQQGATVAPVGSAVLQARIAALLQQPAVAGAHWGIAVMRMDGTPVYTLHEADHFRPASTAKLFTTAVAMGVLGPDAHVSTTITGELDPATGVVTGDLSLVGAGDASLGTQDLPYRPKDAADKALAGPLDLAAMADQVVARGVRHVTGDVVGDDSLFADEDAPEGWAAEDLLWGYGALPSALSLGDNELRLTVRPAASASGVATSAGASEAQVPVVDLDQQAPYLTLATQALTSLADAEAGHQVGVFRVAGSPRTVEVYGNLPPHAAALAEHLAVPEPAAYAATVLRQLLVQRGVQIDGEVRARHANHPSPTPFLSVWGQLGGCGSAFAGETQRCELVCGKMRNTRQTLAEHRSGTLTAEVTFTLKTSANLHAELLLRQMGLRRACPGAGEAQGSALLHTALLHDGIQEGDVVLYDGSGLSTKDLVTPRSEAALLLYASRQPWFGDWRAALPVGGVDGTLAGRFTTTLKGRVLAKTGTLGESRALAGFVFAASGQQLIFSVLDDNHTPGSAADRAAMDEIVTAIAALN